MDILIILQLLSLVAFIALGCFLYRMHKILIDTKTSIEQVNDSIGEFFRDLDDDSELTLTPDMETECESPGAKVAFKDPDTSSFKDINPITISPSTYLYTDGYLSPECARPGCKNSPTHYLKLCLDFGDNDEIDDVEIIVGVGLCLAHTDIPIEDVVMRCSSQLVELGISAVAKESVSVQLGHIGDDGWERWLTENAKRNCAGRA